MYKRILISTDGSDIGQRGVAHGVALAKAVGAHVTFVVVSELFTGITLGGEPPVGLFDGEASLKRASEAAARKILDKAKSLAEAAAVPCELMHVRDKIPADGILETADAKRCDLIVMSSHGWHGLERLLLGSQTTKVATRAKIPVLIVK
jgi:nucleotide-binding universal stress UspA family protein